MENTKNECVSYTYSRHIYRISTLVSMITSRTKLIDMQELMSTSSNVGKIEAKDIG